MELTQKEIRQLKNLREICIDDDLLDIDSYDSIERSNKISDAWEALKVIERITTPLSDNHKEV
jgi:hypothetical protein